MFLRRSFVILALFFCTNASAQYEVGGFCESVDTLMKASATNFNRIKARVMSSDATANMWASTIKLPGSLGYRIVSSMGMFYESAVAQSTDKEELKPAYEEYKKKITECLEPKGYKFSTQENFTAGLSNYPKLVWMIPPKEGIHAEDLPPHVTMEAMYNKDIGRFTVVIFIFQH